MKRLFDLFLVCVLLVLLAAPILFIAIIELIKYSGKAIYWSKRVGKDSVIIKMPKFRTLPIETPEVATHLFNEEKYVFTPFARFLRRSSMDELPQLYSVIKGDMSLVGPRPALFNQTDLISLRKEKGVDKLIPGITGWAQVNGRDSISVADKVSLDVEYIHRKSFWFDIKILFITFFKVIKLKNVSH